MKKLIVLFALAGFPALIAAQAQMPIYVIFPTVTLYANGAAPLVYGGPKVLDAVNINLYASSTGKQLNISTLQIAGDMLMISSKLSGTPSSGSIVFKQSGLYRAFVDYGGNNVTSAGTFRILPGMALDPATPSVGDPVKLSLALGEMVPGDCMPAYSTKATIKGTDILLSFQELMVGACMSPVDTTTYGPSFDLGKLAEGSYTVYIEDSVAVGFFAVTNPVMLNGSALVMQSKYVRHLAQPVAGATISAVQYTPCYWPILLDASYALMSGTEMDTTDVSGLFSIKLPNDQWNYDISASKTGFYPQTIPVDASGLFGPESGAVAWDAHFELIPTSVAPETRLGISVAYNGAPVESAYVGLDAARGFSVCPLMAMAKTSMVVPISTGYWGYTGKTGAITLDSISLTPYIDFIYSVSKTVAGKFLYQSGKIRLNLYDQNTLAINFSGTGVETRVSVRDALGFTVAPNPFNPSTTIFLGKGVQGARIAIYDVAGKLVKDFGAVKAPSVQWNPQRVANGVYIVKANIGKQTLLKKILYQK